GGGDMGRGAVPGDGGGSRIAGEDGRIDAIISVNDVVHRGRGDGVVAGAAEELARHRSGVDGGIGEMQHAADRLVADMIDIGEAVLVDHDRRSGDGGCGYGRSPDARVGVGEGIVRNIDQAAECGLVEYDAGGKTVREWAA